MSVYEHPIQDGKCSFCNIAIGEGAGPHRPHDCAWLLKNEVDDLHQQLFAWKAGEETLRLALRHYAEADEEIAFDSDDNEIVVYNCTPDVARVALAEKRGESQ